LKKKKKEQSHREHGKGNSEIEYLIATLAIDKPKKKGLLRFLAWIKRKEKSWREGKKERGAPRGKKKKEGANSFSRGKGNMKERTSIL